MRIRNIASVGNIFALLFIFWGAWLYTEITEHFARQTFQHEVELFMLEGGRYTKEEAARLEERISALEERLAEDL
jgi:hypothetical protein